MSQLVFQELERVIDRWCGQEPGSYGLGKALQELWQDAYPVSPDYDPVGINSLLEKLSQDPLFGNCEKASVLHRGYFVDGGGIQTVGNLYNFVGLC